VTVNGKSVDIGSERLNCVQAAEKAGVEVPHYCWHPDLTVVASCRMCLVEVGDTKPDGTVAMQPKVVPGCQTLVRDGSVILTDSPRAKAAQASTLEGLLLNHPLDCPVCDKAGECKLQDYSFTFGNAQSRMVDEKNAPPNKPHLSEKITLFTDRCIMCTRCVRFAREISGTAELLVINRGHHAEIDIFPGEPLNNKLSGNVVDLCPVGALGSKDFLYKQRVWFLKSKPAVCGGCSTGCSIHVDHNKDIVFRLRARTNPLSQGSFICDEGRWGYHYANSKDRLGRPRMRAGQSGKLVAAPWSDVVREMRKDFASAIKDSAGQVWVVLSPFLTVEEAYLLASYIVRQSKSVRLALGHVPVVGEDDTFPKDRKGRPVTPVKFTIRAEKCPNRRGIEEVLKHFEGRVTPFADAVAAAEKGQVRAMFLTGGYPKPDWMPAADAASIAKVPLLAVSDLFDSVVSATAKYLLPATTFAEKDGTWVNYAGLAQSVGRTVKPPMEVRAEGQIFFELAERRGLYTADAVRKEVAADLPVFSALKNDLGELGVRL